MKFTLRSPKLADFLLINKELFQKSLMRSVPLEFRAVLRDCQDEWLQCHVDLLRGNQPEMRGLFTHLCEGANSTEECGPTYLQQLIQIQMDALRKFLGDNIEDATEDELDAACVWLHLRYAQALATWCDHDLTEKRRSWERLLRAVTGTLTKPLLILDNQGKILSANPEMARLLGSDPESLKGTDFSALCDDATAAVLRSRVRKRQNILADQKFDGAFTSAPAVRYPMVIRTLFNSEGLRDGFILWIDLETSQAGRLESGILFLIQQAIESLPFPAQLIDSAGNIVVENQPAEELLAAANRQKTAKKICCLISGMSGKPNECACLQIQRNPAISFRELKASTSEDGVPSDSWYRVGIIPIHLPPEEVPWTFCWTVENKSRQELEQRLERIEAEYQVSARTMRLVLSVAMQLRSPLSVILGAAELIRNRPSAERLTEIADMLSRKAVRCKRIIDSLLSFGQGISVDVVPTDLVKLIQDRVRSTIDAARLWRVEWRLPAQPVWVECFPEQMVSVLGAIIDNALYYAKNAVLVEVSATWEQAVIKVSDDGPGVDPKLAEQIFEPFFTTRAEEDAPGLGLALARATIQEHGGEIRLNLDTDRELPGAQFIISLPISPIARESQALIAHRSRVNAPHVLIAEDDPDLRDVLGEMLTEQGFTVTLFDSGDSCLQQLPTLSPDIIVLDIRFGAGLNGIAVYRKIVETVPALRRRIIFITADAMDFEVRKFLRAVDCPVLEKPFILTELVEKIQELVLHGNNTGNVV